MIRFLAPFVLAFGLAQSANADTAHEHDHDAAHEALLRAEVLPLAQVLAQVEAQFAARLIEVEFEQKAGQYIYDFELITVDGQIIEVEVDAATGQVLKVEGGAGGPPVEGDAAHAGSGG